MCPVQGFVCLVITLCTGTAVAASPVARVCASSYYGIFVYDASSSGKLTPIKGSPFYPDTTFLQPAGNGKYLYGVDVNNFHSIDTFQITSNGALTFLRNVDLSSFTGLPVSLTFDHTGQTLYVGFYRGNSDDLVAFTVERGPES
jgi:6-phosphogluconolactonase (cycloisomerase 2 family)